MDENQEIIDRAKLRTHMTGIINTYMEHIDFSAVLPEHQGTLVQACSDIFHISNTIPKLKFSIYPPNEQGVYMIHVVDVDGIMAPMPLPSIQGSETRFKGIVRKSGPVEYTFTVDVNENQ